MPEDECRLGLTESSEIVEALKTSPIIKMTRVYHKSTLGEYIEDHTIANNQIFNTIPGAIQLHLDNGDIIAFIGEDMKDSVVVWFDTHNGIEDDTVYYFRDWANYMDYDDPAYSTPGDWNHIVGNMITKVTVLTIDKGDKKYFHDSFQRIIILETTAGDMVISFSILGLGHPNPLTRKKDIPQEIWDKAVVTEL